MDNRTKRLIRRQMQNTIPSRKKLFYSEQRGQWVYAGPGLMQMLNRAKRESAPLPLYRKFLWSFRRSFKQGLSNPIHVLMLAMFTFPLFVMIDIADWARDRQ